MFTNTGLVSFAKECARRNLPYWYGTVCYKCTQVLLNAKAKQYPGHYTVGRMAKYKGAIAKKLVCMDCVGIS